MFLRKGADAERCLRAPLSVLHESLIIKRVHSILFLTLAAADPALADRFAALALACVHKEFPNKIAHEMASAADAGTPRQLTPAFYGCFDWHSAVHGHWLLARASRVHSNAKAQAALALSITPAHMAREAAYLRQRKSFERPYGLAWLLQLGVELRETNSPLAPMLAPLEAVAVEHLSAWLPKLSYPLRTGQHDQTAFSLGLLLDYAKATSNVPFRTLLQQRARAFYLKDEACPIHYEPGGHDFLSPCIAEADVMRRVLNPAEFSAWFDRFLPRISVKPERVTDPTDGHLAHLDGLNLSRAWMLEGIAGALPKTHARRQALLDLSRQHREAGVNSVSNVHYEGSHWLGSFALYLVTQRGL